VNAVPNGSARTIAVVEARRRLERMFLFII
jgi:hypothetical protein